MDKASTRLTSVKVDRGNHKKFKILCVQNNVTFQTLVNIAVDLYINDNEFRELIAKGK
jgi:hypothetical protein|tara:strand:- start:395 stop:568 length:174 start_codon:yes stop_codon:yes gene_type:complete